MTSFESSRVFFVSRSGKEVTVSTSETWVDIPDLALRFSGSQTGNLLVTLIVPDTWNNKEGGGVGFRLVQIPQSGPQTVLAEGFYYSAKAGQRVPLALACTAKIPAGAGETRIVAQWQVRKNTPGGTGYIGSLGLTSLSAIGDVPPGI